MDPWSLEIRVVLLDLEGADVGGSRITIRMSER